MLTAIEKRRSCRNLDNERIVEEEKINEIVNAGLYAANGRGQQNGIVIVIQDKKVRDALSNLNKSVGNFPMDPFYGAPVILLVASKKSPTAIYDGAAMIENMLIEATNQGLATCWIHRAKEELESKEGQELFSSLGIDLSDYEGIGHIALGYAKNDNYPPKIIKDNRVFYIK